MNVEQMNMTDGPHDDGVSRNNAAVAQPQGDLKPAELSNGTLSKTNLFLVVVFATGIAFIYLMSLRTGPQKVSAEQRAVEMHVDSALSKLGPKMPSNAIPEKSKDVVDKFYHEAKQRQVPISELKSNPFIFEPSGLMPHTLEDNTPEHKSQKSAQARKLSEAMAAARGLVLQSVLTGSGSVAMISNNLLTEGQKIEGWTVIKIQPRKVVLKWEDHTHVLEMAK